MQYETVIGIETHVQLSTRSKMFCSCATEYQTAIPNSLVCPTCLGLPGALPVVNRRAVEYAIMIGTALNCRIAGITKFDRKNYSYPDLPKGYQITQYDQPICYGGYLDLDCDPPHRVRINRVHMEEDVAKLIHRPQDALLDFNRSGMPLMEVVTEPDFKTAQQVVKYIEELQGIIRFLKVGKASMEQGTFRCDANVSIRTAGATKLGTKVEIKNMNRIGAVERAVEYESARQQKVVESGGVIVQETRGWDDETQSTRSQRLKDTTSDYRYFPEPDLPSIKLDGDYIRDIQSAVPELPSQWRRRLIETYGLSKYDVRLLTSAPDKANYFSATVEQFACSDAPQRRKFAKQVANWINGELTHLMHVAKRHDFNEIGIQPRQLCALVDKFIKRELNNSGTKQVLGKLFADGGEVNAIVASEGLEASSEDELRTAVKEVIAANPQAIADIKASKAQAMSFLVGQVMKTTRGRADATAARQLLNQKLGVSPNYGDG